MRRLVPPPTGKLVIFVVLAFFLLWWVPFSHVLPEGFPLRFGTYRTFQGSMIAMWVIVALGLNILTGYNGQISLGHGAFVAVGGYTAAILMVDHGWPFWSTIILGGVMAGTLGFLIGVPALRLTGPYLAIATLGLALSTPQILKKYDGLTHGTQGINVRPSVPPPPDFIEDWFGIQLSNDEWIYFLALFIVVIMTILAVNIVRSRIGRAFVAIRDSEIAAQAMGISVPRYKTMAFAISAFYAGIAGGTYVQVVGYVSPESFSFMLSINFLTTIVIGGLASILGSILGATGLVLVPELPGVVSFIQVLLDRTNPDVFERFKEQIGLCPEVIECHMVAGGFDYLLKVRTSSMIEYLFSFREQMIPPSISTHPIGFTDLLSQPSKKRDILE